MAVSEAHLPPWDRNNQAEAGMLFMSSYLQILNNSRVKLRKYLRLDSVWSHLRELRMFDLSTEKELKFNKHEPDQVSALVDFIEQGPCFRFHIIMRAIVLTSQAHLLPEGVDPNVYTADVPRAENICYACRQPVGSAEHSQPKRFTHKEVQTEVSSCDREETPEHLTFRLLRAIRKQCEYNQRFLVRTHLYAFDGDSGDDWFDFTNCYINVQPLMKDGNLVPIEVGEILQPFKGSLAPCVIRVYADPGDGKTSFAKHVIHKWSIEFLQQIIEEDGKLLLKSKHAPWSTMVYLHARDIKTTVEDPIRESLGCSQKDVYTLMAHIVEGEGVVVFIDGIDELRNTKALEELKNYVRERQKGGPTVVLLCRTDLCDIDARYIDRFLTLQGFNGEQGLRYVELYTEMCKVSQPPKAAVYEYILRHKARFTAVLANPLKLHVFCALALRRELELGEEDEFNISNLLGSLERYLLKREGVEVSKSQSQDFYKFCFYALIHDKREFSISQLIEFKVVPSYHVFLVKFDRRNEEGDLIPYYKFPHEMILEFFSSRYIHNLNNEERMSFFFNICSDKVYRNIQNIVFQLLLQEGNAQLSLIQTMMRATVILQSALQEKFSKWRALRQSFSSSPTVPRKVFNRRQNLNLTSMKNAHAVFQKIDRMYDSQTEVMRQEGWFKKVQEDTIRHLVKCLEVFSLDQREKLLKGTIIQMMPTTYKIGQEIEASFYPTADYRWTEISGPTLSSWCPSDAAQVMQKHTSSIRHPYIDMHIDQYYDLWGQPDEACWSQHQWRRLLDVVDKWRCFSLHLHVHQVTPLKGLLTSLSLHAWTYNLSIYVYRGRVQWSELVSWKPCYKKLTLHLGSTHIVVPEGWTPPLEVREYALQREPPCLWMTDDGTWREALWDRPDGGRVRLNQPVWVTDSSDRF